GEALAEVGEKAGVGAVPAKNRLVRIAHDTEVGSVPAPAVEQAVLHGVDVLELVHEEMPEAPALRGREPLVVLEGAGAQQQQVVEVDKAAPPLLLLVALVQRS